MRNLKAYSDSINIQYKSRLSNAQTIFFPIQYDLKKLRKHKGKGGKIIQRLDGIYYPSKQGEKYSKSNAIIREIYLKLADHIVFQSDYSRKQCFEMFGEVSTEKYSLITNGVDRTIFKEKKSTNMTLNGKVRLVTTGNFRNLDMLEPVIKALDCLSVSLQLDVIGPIVNDDLRVYLDRPYLSHLGSMNSEAIAEVLPNYDIFIYSHLNPPCPNSVLEAVACGIPVVGFDSGGMKELLSFSDGLLAEVSEDVFQSYSDFKSNKLLDKILLCINEYPYWKEKAMDNCDKHNFNICGEKYLDLFRSFGLLQSSKNTFFSSLVGQVLKR